MSEPEDIMIVRSTIKRSGPRMTITGERLDRTPVKVSADLIEAPSQGRIYWRAKDNKSGKVYLLS